MCVHVDVYTCLYVCVYVHMCVWVGGEGGLTTDQVQCNQPSVPLSASAAPSFFPHFSVHVKMLSMV